MPPTSPTNSYYTRNFWRAAEMHEDSVRRLLKQTGATAYSTLAIEAVYLSGYVVECSMKAAILSRTPCGKGLEKHEKLIEEFRDRMKHNLEALKHRLAVKSIHIHGEDQDRLRLFVTKWRTDMRYLLANERYSNKEAKEFADAASKLKLWLRQQV